MAKELMAEIHEDENGIIRRSDMTLRDWFAGQAAAAVLGGLTAAQVSTEPEAAKHIAKASYLLADAMLEARK